MWETMMKHELIKMIATSRTIIDDVGGVTSQRSRDTPRMTSPLIHHVMSAAWWLLSTDNDSQAIEHVYSLLTEPLS